MLCAAVVTSLNGLVIYYMSLLNSYMKWSILYMLWSFHVMHGSFFITILTCRLKTLGVTVESRQHGDKLNCLRKSDNVHWSTDFKRRRWGFPIYSHCLIQITTDSIFNNWRTSAIKISSDGGANISTDVRDKTSIKILDVQQQENGFDCGLFAIANLVAICFSSNYSFQT